MYSSRADTERLSRQRELIQNAPRIVKESRKEARSPPNARIREQIVDFLLASAQLRLKIRHKDIGTRLAGLKGETNKENFCDTVFLAGVLLKLLNLYYVRRMVIVVLNCIS